MDNNRNRKIQMLGYAFEEIPLKSVKRGTYIAPDGHEMYNLPMDSYHLARYLSRGFKVKNKE